MWNSYARYLSSFVYKPSIKLTSIPKNNIKLIFTNSLHTQSIIDIIFHRYRSDQAYYALLQTLLKEALPH